MGVVRAIEIPYHYILEAEERRPLRESLKEAIRHFDAVSSILPEGASYTLPEDAGGEASELSILPTGEVLVSKKGRVQQRLQWGSDSMMAFTYLDADGRATGLRRIVYYAEK